MPKYVQYVKNYAKNSCQKNVFSYIQNQDK